MPTALLFFCTINQRIIGCIQRFSDCLQLCCLDVLRASLNFYQALSGDVASVNLQQTNKIRLTQFACLPNSADVFSDSEVLLYLLLHNITPCGLNLVHFLYFRR